MEDDFLEEDDNIFGDDEVLDYIVYEEVEKELDKKKSSSGCLSTILMMILTCGSFAMLVLWIVG